MNPPPRRGDAEIDLNRITEQIIRAAIEVHRLLGPGLLESVYEDSLSVEFRLQNIPFKRQVAVPLFYKDHPIGHDLKVDLFVKDQVVVELKPVDQLLPVHHAQLLTYLRLLDKRVGLLINFNVPLLKAGIKRIVNGFDDSASPRLGGGS